MCIPLAVCIALTALFATSQTVAWRGQQQASSWNEHAITMLQLQVVAMRYVEAAVGRTEPGTVHLDREQAAANVDAISARSLKLASEFSDAEQAEEQELSNAVRELIARGERLTREEVGRFLSFHSDEVTRRLEDRVTEELTGSRAAAGASHTRALDIFWVSILGAGILLACGVVLSLLLARTMTRSLSYLGNEAARVAEGDLGRTITLSSGDELAQLASAFNAMVTGLHDTMVHRSSLEREVEHRTSELAEANSLLARTNVERHRILFDLSPVPVWAIDGESLQFIAVNETTLRLYGYSRDELLGATLNLLSPEHARSILDSVTRTPHEHKIMRHHCKDGRLVDVDMFSHAITLDGRACILAIGIDVTDARKMEAQLRQAQKLEAIGQLAAGVAHDFNNVLAAIIANAEMAGEAIGQDHPDRMAIDEIIAASQRGASLTRQLLAFSRKQPTHPKLLDPNAVVRGIERMLGRLIGERILMTTVLDAGVGAVMADPGQLEQVLTNLVVNARDAMPTGGVVAIETFNVSLDVTRATTVGLPPGPYVAIAVRDTGCGIDEAIRARLFEPFFTTKDVGKGTGLGLATVFGIVKHSDGAIAISSELGRGSTFTIYLPYLPPVADPAVAAVVPRPTMARSGTETILVVEDEDAVRRTLCRMLGGAGFRVLEARDGLAALDVLEGLAEPIDLLLTDIAMPRMDGRTLVELVRRRQPHLRVVFISGYADHDSVKTGSTGDPEVQKPFTAADLLAVIRKVLEAPTRVEQPAREPTATLPSILN